ncbi:hypothetical protein SUGI_0550980 [Cryptomeria japonica]|nr:hypothetical protein SUGI_0550980 [Cryptomeria japonica]
MFLCSTEKGPTKVSSALNGPDHADNIRIQLRRPRSRHLTLRHSSAFPTKKQRMRKKRRKKKQRTTRRDKETSFSETTGKIVERCRVKFDRFCMNVDLSVRLKWII